MVIMIIKKTIRNYYFMFIIKFTKSKNIINDYFNSFLIIEIIIKVIIPVLFMKFNLI